MCNKRLILALVIAACICLVFGVIRMNPRLAWSAEKEYPNKPITFVINFPPGSSGDVPMRIAHGLLQETLGVPIVLENKAGAGGGLAADFVAKAKPDGYTILAGGAAGLTIGPTINAARTSNYTHFASVCSYSADYVAVVCRPNAPFKNLKEIIDYAKKNPGKLNCATAGNGSVAHFFLEFFKMSYGVDIVPVHFAGGPPAKNAIMGGHVDLACPSLGSMIPLIKSGDLILLVTGAPKRVKDFPDVPTMADEGFPKALTIWSGIFAPAKCPKPVVNKLSKAMAKVFNDPEVIAKIEKAGLNPDYLDSVLTEKRLVQEFNTVTEIVQKGRIGKLKPEEMK
jgi:tripartite-type tricarboxylate transporter receptor subunit TctC